MPQSKREGLGAFQAALLRLYVSAKSGINAALVAPALCFEEIHHIRVKPDREKLSSRSGTSEKSISLSFMALTFAQSVVGRIALFGPTLALTKSAIALLNPTYGTTRFRYKNLTA